MKGPSKKFLWASRLWVGRRKEPILGYVPKNYVKKNSGSKGLIVSLNNETKDIRKYIPSAVYEFFYAFIR